MKTKVAVAVAAVVVVIGGFWFARDMVREGERSRVEEIPQQDQALTRESALKLGRDGAPVTVVEFFDPECESCRAFHPMVKQLLEEYEGKIQVVARYAPFHPNSRFAIKILEAARQQNRYWETLELLYHHQPEWGDHHHPRPELIWTYLPRLDLDMEKLKEDMESPAIEQIIQEDLEDGQKLGVRMTPTFFVNGEPLLDFGYEPLKALIARALERAGSP